MADDRTGVRKGRTLAERRRLRREALLEAALELFGTKGYAATSVEEICRTASVSTRNFYEEFDNREDLLVALFDTALNRLVAALHQSTLGEGIDGMADHTSALVGGFVHGMVDDPRVARVALIEAVGVSPRMEQHRRAIYRAFTNEIASTARRYAEKGLLPDRNFELIGMGMVGAISEILVDWLETGATTDIDELIDAIFHMVALSYRGVLPAEE